MLDHLIEEVIADFLAEFLQQLNSPRTLSKRRGDTGQDGIQPLLLNGRDGTTLHTLLQEHVVHLETKWNSSDVIWARKIIVHHWEMNGVYSSHSSKLIPDLRLPLPFASDAHWSSVNVNVKHYSFKKDDSLRLEPFDDNKLSLKNNPYCARKFWLWWMGSHRSFFAPSVSINCTGNPVIVEQMSHYCKINKYNWKKSYLWSAKGSVISSAWKKKSICLRHFSICLTFRTNKGSVKAILVAYMILWSCSRWCLLLLCLSSFLLVILSSSAPVAPSCCELGMGGRTENCLTPSTIGCFNTPAEVGISVEGDIVKSRVVLYLYVYLIKTV